jgi:hypothetical protein
MTFRTLLSSAKVLSISPIFPQFSLISHQLNQGEKSRQPLEKIDFVHVFFKYSRGWKFLYLVLKYTPFYSVLAGSVSLSQEKGVVICAHFSLLTQTPLPPLFLTLPLNITNYFTAKRDTVKQPFYGTQNEIYERLINKSSRIKWWRDRIVAINRICLSALFSIHFAFRKRVA